MCDWTRCLVRYIWGQIHVNIVSEKSWWLYLRTSWRCPHQTSLIASSNIGQALQRGLSRLGKRTNLYEEISGYKILKVLAETAHPAVKYVSDGGHDDFQFSCDVRARDFAARWSWMKWCLVSRCLNYVVFRRLSWRMQLLLAYNRLVRHMIRMKWIELAKVAVMKSLAWRQK